jgi:ppGpp synthetase/RelA/SpoT-type nucleotidyltranferase
MNLGEQIQMFGGTMMKEQKPNKLFCKANVEQIVVPDIVKDDLLSIIEEKLQKAGFYYRVVYRVKAIDSMVDKLLYKDYGRPGTENENKKMQDLIGIRILMYFTDDLNICRNLLDTLFVEPGVWETTEITEYEFKAMKVNGTFKLPAYLSKTIVNPMLSDYVDDTFEIQIRTNSFEGWHEIEHDLRYKGSAFGVGNESLARKMNSILATLELCDDSVVKLLEDLGHQHYKAKKWGDMIRCHYRLKLDNEPLHPLIREIFDSDTELAKKFFKFNRAKAITQLWSSTADKGMNLTVTNIIKLVNQLGPNDERLKDAFIKIDKDQTDYDNGGKRKRFEPFKQLGTYTVFKADTYIDTSNLQEIDAFKKSAALIYSWVKSRYTEVFPDIPDSIESYNGNMPGYSVKVQYDEKQCFVHERSTHLDSKMANRMWISNATISKDTKGLHFVVTNEYAEPVDRYRDTENVLFSRPNFYGEIADNVGLCDVARLKENVRAVDDESYRALESLIHSSERKFPVIVFMATDEDWTDKFDINYFAYLVGYYAHIKKIEGEDNCKRFANHYHLDMERYGDSITVFYPGMDAQTSYKSDILDTTFEVIKFEQKKYWNENGCRAYRRQLVSQIRENNVTIK